MPKYLRGLLACVAGLGIALPVQAQGPVNTPRVHALTNVRIVQSPGVVIENGTVVIRDGIIEAVGASVAIPPDARVWEHDSLTVYAGLIDLAMQVDPPKTDDDSEVDDLGHELGVVHSDYSTAEALNLKSSDAEARRGQGILSARLLPNKGVFRGESALVNLGDGDLSENLLKSRCGQVMAYSTSGGNGDDSYPNSKMGAVAVMRQVLYDAQWYDQAQTVYAASPRGKQRPEANAAFAALVPAVKGTDEIIFVTGNVLDLLRAGEMGKEFNLKFEYVGSGEEYKRLDDIKPYTSSIVVPVNFPKAPSVDDPGQALGVTTATLRHWDEAPANAARVHEAGYTLALTADGLKDVGSFRKNVGKAIEAGLPADEALASLTVVPARMLGVDDRIGTVEKGKIANIVVTDGDLFDEKTKVREVWVDGARYELEEVKPPQGDPRGTWEVVAEAGDGSQYPSTLVITGEIGSISAVLKMMGQEFPVEATQSGATVKVSFSSQPLGMPGTITMNFEMKGDKATGSGESPMGGFALTATRTSKPEGGTVR